MDRQTYVVPSVDVVELNATDVIRTSEPVLDSAKLLAGNAAWGQNWTTSLGGMEGMK